ncbi:MAG: AgmX/PglI C-terminal domain-containing protein [Myxococcota bacterium]
MPARLCASIGSPRLVSLALLVFGAVCVSACGGDEKPPPKTQVEAGAPKTEGNGLRGIRTSSEIGGMNEEQVDATFKSALASLERCLNRGTERIEFLGGSVSFFIKVNSDGKVSESYLEKSTLGDRETEKCMLSTLRNRSWPKPVGGMHGLARKSFDFDPPNDVRPPLEWDSEHIKSALKKLSDKLDECRDGNAGTFEATAYVSTEGSVLAAGVTPPNQAGESAVDCMVEAIRGASFPSPGSWPAKVSFSL